MNDSSKQRTVGIVLSYSQMALNILIGLVYTPVMIRLLGQSEYGLYSTVVSVISVLSVLSLGFGSGYLKYYAKYRSASDWEAVWKLNGLFLTFFSIMGVVALVLGTVLSFNLKLVFQDGFTEKELETARVLMLMLTVNLAISFPASVFSTIITANEKFIVHKALQMVKTVATPLMTLPLLLLGAKSIGLVVTTVVLALLTELFNVYYVFKHLKNKFVFKNFEKGLLVSIFSYTFFILLNTIVRQINWNVEKIILGRFMGTAVVAVYSVAFSLYVYYETFSTSISSVCRTKVHLIVNETKNDTALQRRQLTEYFTSIGRIQFFVLSLVLTGFLIFGRAFIEDIWVGPDYAQSYYIALLLLVSSSVYLIQNIGIDIQRALNKHKFRSIVYIGMAVLNLVLTIVLCQKYGAIGATFGTAISMLLVDGIIMNTYYHKACNVDIVFFWRSILRALPGVLLPLAVGLLIAPLLDLSKLWLFGLSILVYCLLYVISIYFVSLKKEEKLALRNQIAKIKGRFSGKV